VPSIRILAPVGDEYTITLPVVTVSVRDSAGLAVATAVDGRETAMVVSVGMAVICAVLSVVCGETVAVCDATGVVCATVAFASGVTLVVCCRVVSVSGGVALSAGIVADGVVVSLAALTGSTIRRSRRNSATGMTDDPYPRDIQKPHRLRGLLIPCE
jgi:hypothetical protein